MGWVNSAKACRTSSVSTSVARGPPVRPRFLGAGELPEDAQLAPHAPVGVQHHARQLISAEIGRQCAEARVIEALVLGPHFPPD